MPTPLIYPKDLEINNSDFVKFEHFGYRVNDAIKYDVRNTPVNRGGTGKYSDAPRKGKQIILYMPNTTPPTQQLQTWRGQTFDGPKGQFIKQNLDLMAGASIIGAGEAGEQRRANPAGVGGQLLLEFLAGQLGQDANTALQLGRGQIYNPNVELLYEGPKLRRFAFDFNFIPKSPEDTKEVDQIIREFKYWSSPGVEGTNFLTVPDLWMVTYYNADKGEFKRMNPWKPAALEEVIVQDNPMSDLHSTIEDPNGDVPVHTKISLRFCETDIITRKDHDESAPDYMSYGKQKKGRGYYRGF